MIKNVKPAVLIIEWVLRRLIYRQFTFANEPNCRHAVKQKSHPNSVMLSQDDF